MVTREEDNVSGPNLEFATHRSSVARGGAVLRNATTMFSSQSSLEVNHQSESRMREIRTAGSEGEGTEQSVLPTPIVDHPEFQG
jgi:hypothetical protein